MRLDHLLLGSIKLAKVSRRYKEQGKCDRVKTEKVFGLISFLFVFNKRVLSLAGRRPRAREALFFEEAAEMTLGAGNRKSKKLCAGTGV